jgi:hypothetical protein
MVLTIFVVWLVLAALAVFFMYCCSRVSEGPRRENRDNEPTEQAPTHVTAATRAHPI